MMDFMTGGSLSSVLAPKLEVGQEALYDALRARDSMRATRIVKRVARDVLARREGAGRGGSVRSGSGSGVRRQHEVRETALYGVVEVLGNQRAKLYRSC